MPHYFNQAALAIMINSMKGHSHERPGYLEQKMAAVELAVSITLEYTSDHFDIVPEVEKKVVDIIGAADQSITNVQFHVAGSPSIIIADKFFSEIVFANVFSQLYYSIQQGVLVTVHITKTDDSCIIEIQESGNTKNNLSSFDNSIVNTDQPLIVCQNLMEDMGGEMVYLLKDTEKYFRLKFLLG